MQVDLSERVPCKRKLSAFLARSSETPYSSQLARHFHEPRSECNLTSEPCTLLTSTPSRKA